MYTFTRAGKLMDLGFSSFNFFLFYNSCPAIFRWFNFRITFWKNLGRVKNSIPLPKAGQQESRLLPKCSILLSNSLARMSSTSRHYLLECCSLAWYFCSRLISFSLSVSFTFQKMCKSDSSLVNLVLIYWNQF